MNKRKKTAEFYITKALHPLILTYLSPKDTPDAIHVLLTKFSTTKDWIKSFQIKTINKNGYEIRVRGELHAEDEPALVKDGVESWYKWNQLHRTDGPAIVRDNGEEEWFFNGKYHRLDGPALKVAEGKYWYWHGIQHREDGPAFEGWDGHEEWRVGGQLHRTDGPAVIHVDGTIEWYLHNKLQKTETPPDSPPH